MKACTRFRLRASLHAIRSRFGLGLVLLLLLLQLLECLLNTFEGALDSPVKGRLEALTEHFDEVGVRSSAVVQVGAGKLDAGSDSFQDVAIELLAGGGEQLVQLAFGDIELHLVQIQALTEEAYLSGVEFLLARRGRNSRVEKVEGVGSALLDGLEFLVDALLNPELIQARLVSDQRPEKPGCHPEPHR